MTVMIDMDGVISTGSDAAGLQAALELALSIETPWPVELSAGLAAVEQSREPPPWNEVIGPIRDRGGPNGLVYSQGQLLARWGDTRRVDMTFSIAKSYLAILSGIALRDGLIRDLDDPVRGYVRDAGFEAPHNQPVSWRQLLNQTSEWEGSLWDKPDLVDRNRRVGVGADNSGKGTYRELRAPGSFWEYNDVRVNRLSFSLMQVFGESLGEVLSREIMQPIGASTDWVWHGYRNSYYELDGRLLHSVPGGSHWGGGLWIASEDHARVGQLLLADGVWQGRTILPPGWVDSMFQPCSRNRGYGLLWWLNTAQRLYPSAPSSSVFAIGAGTNFIWLDRPRQLLVVARWMDQARIDDFCAALVAAVH